jgi:ribosome maturation factor RimP
MMDLKAKIEEILTALQSEMGSFYVVEVSLGGSRNRPKVTLLIDNDAGITIDECAEVSRKVAEQLDAIEAISQTYSLEVSSPGVDYPLQSERQYLKNVGRMLQVWLKNDTEIIGKLEAHTPEGIVLTEVPKKSKSKQTEPSLPVTIPLDQIQKAQVQVSFK